MFEQGGRENDDGRRSKLARFGQLDMRGCGKRSPLVDRFDLLSFLKKSQFKSLRAEMTAVRRFIAAWQSLSCYSRANRDRRVAMTFFAVFREHLAKACAVLNTTLKQLSSAVHIATAAISQLKNPTRWVGYGVDEEAHDAQNPPAPCGTGRAGPPRTRHD